MKKFLGLILCVFMLGTITGCSSTEEIVPTDVLKVSMIDVVKAPSKDKLPYCPLLKGFYTGENGDKKTLILNLPTTLKNIDGYEIVFQEKYGDMEDYSATRTVFLSNKEKEFILEYDEETEVILKLRVYKETKDACEYSSWSNVIIGKVE